MNERPVSRQEFEELKRMVLANQQLSRRLNHESGNTVLEYGQPPASGAVVYAATTMVRRVYTSNDTWTKPANLLYVLVRVQAGGGGGGGVTGDSAEFQAGSGGGGGGYSEKYIPAVSLGATETVTVGTGGGGGSSSGGDGGAGNNSSFGSHATANGGGAGQGAVDNDPQHEGAGGTAASGDINIPGEPGWVSFNPSDVDTGAQHSVGGHGGRSHMGSGGKGGLTSNIVAFGDSEAGGTGAGYGGGGGGAAASETTSGAAGGAGKDGVVIVDEYYDLTES